MAYKKNKPPKKPGKLDFVFAWFKRKKPKKTDDYDVIYKARC